MTVDHKLDETSYDAITRPPNAQHNTLAGPGESLPLRSISLALEGVIRVEGTLLRLFLSPRTTSKSLATLLSQRLAEET